MNLLDPIYKAMNSLDSMSNEYYRNGYLLAFGIVLILFTLYVIIF